MGTQISARSPRRWIAPGALLVLVAAGLYVQTIGYEYTHLDDFGLLEENRDYLRDPAHLFLAFTEDGFAFIGEQSSGLYYRPMLWVSFILDEQVAPSSVAFHHATNVFLHVIAVCGLFALLILLSVPRARALVLSLLFAAHPALVPAVAWIPGRNDLLVAVFVLATMGALVSFAKREDVTRTFAVVIAFALALFTKESAIACAVVAPLLFLERKGRDALRVTPARAVLAIGCAAVLLLWLAMRRSALDGFPLFLSKMVSNVPMAFVYLGKTFLPFDLAPIPSVTGLGLGLGVASAAGLLGLAWLSRDRLLGLFGVGLVWYGAFLFPALLAPPQTRGLEHRLYVPLLGLAIALAVVRWPDRLAALPRARAVASGLAVAVFAALSLARMPEYRDAMSFWGSAAEQSPRPAEALKYLSVHYYDANRLDEAEAACRRALSLDPNDPQLWLQLERIEARRSERGGA